VDRDPAEGLGAIEKLLYDANDVERFHRPRVHRHGPRLVGRVRLLIHHADGNAAP
jgi:hypothetical protein